MIPREWWNFLGIFGQQTFNMPFIVEMFHGRSNKMEIMGLTEDGDLCVSKVIELGPPDPDFQKFSCSDVNWNNALQLGEKMGWKPAGTILETRSDYLHTHTGDYEPCGDDFKTFTAEDASGLADALDKALEVMTDPQLQQYGQKRGILLTSLMTETEFKQVNRGLTREFFKDFIRFLRKGEFSFIWDD